MSPRFLLAYGSQTGQSKAVAEQIFEKSSKIGLDADIKCFSLYGKQFTFESETVVVIVISSTGDGEPPDTARKFYRAIHAKTLSATHFSNLRYALLGLGDSNYTSCWNCPKTVDKRLQELGAVHFYPSGFADDACGLEMVVEPWVEGLLVALTSQLRSPDTVIPPAGLMPAAVMQQPVTGDRPSSAASPEELPAIEVTAKLQELQLDVKASSNGDTAEISRAIAAPAEGLIGSKEHADPAAETSTSTVAAAVTTSKGVADDMAATAPDDPGVEARRIRSPRLRCVALTLPTRPERFLCVTVLDRQCTVTQDEDVRRAKAKASNPDSAVVSILRADVLTGPAAPKKTLRLQLGLTTDSGLSYEPGDAFGLHCENDASEVQWLLERLMVPESETGRPVSISVMQQCSRKLARVPDHLVCSASLRQLFTYCTDIRAIPKKAFICLAAEYTSEESERLRLLELSSREGSDDYTDIVMAGRISFLELLAFFPTCQPPVEVMLENLPPLQPRFYSAASSQLSQTDSVDIVFNIMQLRPFEGRARTGLCTGWLNQLTSELQAKKGTPCSLPKVFLFPRKVKHFRLPSSVESPMLMVCAGTGIAPFMGFIEHRYRQQIANPDASLGKMWLFYGCRDVEKDLLFRDKLLEMVQLGVLAKCVVCLSQQKQIVDLPSACSTVESRAEVAGRATTPQPNCTEGHTIDCAGLTCAGMSSNEPARVSTIPEPVGSSPLAMQESSQPETQEAPRAVLTSGMCMVPGYVQDALGAEAHAVVEMIWTEGAHIYVCGSNAMARGVLAAITNAIAGTREVSAAEASAMVKELKLSKRYLEDVWS